MHVKLDLFLPGLPLATEVSKRKMRAFKASLASWHVVVSLKKGGGENGKGS